MRELNNRELSQIAGSNMFSDLQTVYNDGLSQPDQTFGVVTLSGGILMGAALPSSWFIAPVVAATLLGGWYFYTCSHD